MRRFSIYVVCACCVLVHAGFAMSLSGCLQKQPHRRRIDAPPYYPPAQHAPQERGDYPRPDSKRGDHYRYPVYPLPYYGEREA